MAQTDALKRYLDAGMAFTKLTRKRAEQVVKDLVAAGDLHRSQAKETIEQLIERSHANADVLAEQVRKEVDGQLSALGLARKADVERLEAEVRRLHASGGATSGPAERDEPALPAPEAPTAKVGNVVPAVLPANKAAPVKKAAVKKAPVAKKAAPVKKAAAAKKVAKATNKKV